MSTRCSIYFDSVVVETYDPEKPPGEAFGQASIHCHIWFDVNEPHVGVHSSDAETFFIPMDKVDGLIEGLIKAKEYWK